jgi:sterol desaturase/sphingolipid hydroxylase (fatty acid hydroxylase superfamily)
MDSYSFSDQWNLMLDKLGLDDRIIFTIGTVGVHLFIFWTLNTLLFIFYRFNLFPERRIQGLVQPSTELWNAAMINCLKNHFIVQPIATYFMYPLFVYFGMKIRGPIPGFIVFMRDFAISIILNDTLFYWAHRMFHHKLIYKHIHKQHHLFKTNIGIASEYAHPVEDIVANLIPTLIGCLIMGSHALVLWAWLALRISETVDAHSGYNFQFSPFSFFPFQGGAERHDFHHSNNVGCYGSFTIFWDYIMGTDAAFLEFQRKGKETSKNAGVTTLKTE